MQIVRGQGGAEELSLEAPYGPAKSLSPDQVATLNEWLKTVSADSIRAAFDGAAMDEAGIYPEIWTEDPRVLDDYLLPNFDSLKGFFDRAAEARQPVLVFFS